MFISAKRHRRELDRAGETTRELIEEILACVPDGICLVAEDDRVLAPLSRPLSALLGGRDHSQTRFSKLLYSILPADTVAAAVEHMRLLRTAENVAELRAANPLASVRARILTADGGFVTRNLRFDFRRPDLAAWPRALIVTVSDITESIRLSAELAEMRHYSNTQRLCLSSLVRLGAERFAVFLQRTDAAMTTINMIMKKPARESAAFQDKLQAILIEVRRVAADAKSLKIDSIDMQAREFEHALEALCRREALSGADFLPLAVQLDGLSAQLALMRSLTSTPRSSGEAQASSAPQAYSPSSTPKAHVPPYASPSLPAAPSAPMRAVSAGSLESTLLALTDHFSQILQRSVTLSCAGLETVPVRHQAMIKDISTHLIRNALKLGIETPEERVAAGKLAFGKLDLEFSRRSDGGFDFSFEDDGRGLDSAGTRIAAVRRLVAEANGEISLSTLPGRQTRFQISLPPVTIDHAQVA